MAKMKYGKMGSASKRGGMDTGKKVTTGVDAESMVNRKAKKGSSMSKGGSCMSSIMGIGPKNPPTSKDHYGRGKSGY